MNTPISVRRVTFCIPPKGALEQTGPEDPLFYYYRPFVGYLYRARIRNALSLIIPPYDSILELGYGSGILLPTLASIGKTVCGIDIESDPESVQRHLEKLGVRASLQRCDLRNTAYPDESFDLIVGISIFEHISDLEPALSEVHRLLKASGHFLVGMPRVDPLMGKLFSLIGYPEIKEHHVTTYRQFLDAARRCFTLIKFSKTPPFVPSFAALYFNMLLHKRNRNSK